MDQQNLMAEEQSEGSGSERSPHSQGDNINEESPEQQVEINFGDEAPPQHEEQLEGHAEHEDDNRQQDDYQGEAQEYQEEQPEQGDEEQDYQDEHPEDAGEAEYQDAPQADDGQQEEHAEQYEGQHQEADVQDDQQQQQQAPQDDGELQDAEVQDAEVPQGEAQAVVDDEQEYEQAQDYSIGVGPAVYTHEEPYEQPQDQPQQQYHPEEHAEQVVYETHQVPKNHQHTEQPKQIVLQKPRSDKSERSASDQSYEQEEPIKQHAVYTTHPIQGEQDLPPRIQPEPIITEPLPAPPIMTPVSRVSQTYEPKPVIITESYQPQQVIRTASQNNPPQTKVVTETYQPKTIIRTSTTEPKEVRMSSAIERQQHIDSDKRVVMSAIVAPPVEEAILQEAVVSEQPVPVGPQIEYQILLPNEEEIKGTDLYRMISLAYEERRSINLKYFAKFIHNRNHYYLKHSEVLDDITECLLGRISKTSRFLTETESYLQEMCNSYRQLFQETQKSKAFQYVLQPANPRTKSNFQWSQHATNGMKSLVTAANNISSRMRSFEYYLSTTCIETLRKINNTFNQNMKKAGKTAMGAKAKFCEAEQQLVEAVQKLWKNNKKDRKSKDLLLDQIRIVEIMQRNKQLIKIWSLKKIQWWKYCIEVEKNVAEQYKDVMRGYLQASKDLHNIDDQTQRCLKYWSQTDTSSQIEFQYKTHRLLSIISVDFISNSLGLLNNIMGKELTFERLETWAQINNEQGVTGSRAFILESLLIKRFECEYNTGSSWIKAVLLSTIDEGLLLLSETPNELRQGESPDYRLLKTFRIKNLMNTRKDELTVSINEKVKGLIFDSWKKEIVRFAEVDQAEGFMFFTENQPQVKAQYIA